MTVAAFLLAAAGLAFLGGSRSPAARRLRSLPPQRARAHVGRATAPVAAGVLAAVAVAVLLGGVPGVGLGVAAAAFVHRVVGRLKPAASRAVQLRRAADLPVVLDLLAVCLRAGKPFVLAAEIVAAALPGPLAGDLSAAAALQRLGADPAAAWARYEEDPVLAPVVRLIRRSVDSGSRLAAAFERLAADLRVAQVARGEQRARRAGVLAIVPLGFCYLPAFLCLGVVPLLLSLADGVLD